MSHNARRAAFGSDGGSSNGVVSGPSVAPIPLADALRSHFVSDGAGMSAEAAVASTTIVWSPPSSVKV